jgi:hypothetical protein
MNRFGLPLLGLLTVVIGGCASLRGPVEQTGQMVTVHNERSSLVDLSYRCVENGAVRRLGPVEPRSSRTFAVGPCATLYLVSHTGGIVDMDARSFATVPLFDDSPIEIVLGLHGGVMRR